MKRRDFVRICAASATGAALPDASRAATLTARIYPRAKLVDERRHPGRIASLQAGTNYVFDYPYLATPCFLLRLERPAITGMVLKTEAGEPYVWEGGVGSGKNVR